MGIRKARPNSPRFKFPWEKKQLKELTPSEVEEITDVILSLPVRIEPSKTLLPLSVEIAMAYGFTVCDAMYISLAKVYETTMITADRKLADTTAKTNLKDSITWLGNYKQFFRKRRR